MIVLVSNIKKVKKVEEEVKKEEQKEKEKISSPIERPYVLDAKVYKLKSKFVKHSVFVTIGYIKEKDGKIRPFEIFLNSKDLTKAAEFTILTRLLSAIFRRSEDPTFVLEELRSVYDPNGVGYFKDGKYINSFYAELADILEEFFIEAGLIKKEKEEKRVLIKLSNNSENNLLEDANFQICPKCGMKTLKVEEGCYTCINPECGYSKCN
ncbi:MAG: hypothetical protein QW197_02050 [Candidatus Aenigmatarchaeota archaeon]